MRLNLYCVFDVAAKVYDRPFCAQSDGSAIRSFGDVCVSAEHPFGQHPEDYSLFRIGHYDDNTAVIVAEDRECLVTGLEMVAQRRKIDPAQLDAFDTSVSAEN